jgi:RNA polymerase sigma-70 factor (sigma-E family)
MRVWNLYQGSISVSRVGIHCFKQLVDRSGGAMLAADLHFESFVRENWEGLVRHAYLIVRDRGHAEDAVQSALERCHRRWSTAEACISPYAYVRAAVTNEAVTRARRRRFLEVSLSAVMDRCTEDLYARADDRRDLWVALGRLPPRMRAVLVLRYVVDLSERETAAELRCSVGSVKSQSSRGLKRLRSNLSPRAAVGAVSVIPTA